MSRITITFLGSLKLWWYGLVMDYKFDKFVKIVRINMFNLAADSSNEIERIEFVNAGNNYWNLLKELSNRA